MPHPSNKTFRETVAAVLKDVSEVKQVTPYRIAKRLRAAPSSVYRWFKAQTEMPFHYAILMGVYYPTFLMKLIRIYKDRELNRRDDEEEGREERTGADRGEAVENREQNSA